MHSRECQEPQTKLIQRKNLTSSCGHRRCFPGGGGIWSEQERKCWICTWRARRDGILRSRHRADKSSESGTSFDWASHEVWTGMTGGLELWLHETILYSLDSGEPRRVPEWGWGELMDGCEVWFLECLRCLKYAGTPTRVGRGRNTEKCKRREVNPQR